MSNYYTKEQAQAIFHDEGNLIISASAGAGKTFSLVEYLQTLICGPDPKQKEYILNNPTKYGGVRIVERKRLSVDDILAITFTENAAANMKAKLSKRLKSIKDEKALAERDKITNANISTINSFCLEIIKKFYLCIGLDLSTVNNTLTDEKISLIRNEAFNELINNLENSNFNKPFENCELSKEQINKIKKFISKENFIKANRHINTSIFSLDNFKSVLEKIILEAKNNIEPVFWMLNNLEEKTIEDIKHLDKKLLDAYVLSLLNKMKQINAKIKKIKKLIVKEKKEVASDDNLKSIVTEDKDFKELNEEIIENIVDNKTYENFICYVENINNYFCFLNVARKTKNQTATQNSIRQEREKLEKLIKKFFEKIVPLNILISSCNKNNEIKNILVAFSVIYYFLIQEKKKEKSCIEFSDQEHFAYKILKNNQEARNYYRNKFKKIMVDEFQDTNNIQNEIINMISNNNLFLVGDVKQAIYRFRGANPNIFMDYFYNNKNFKKITFKSNFRSDKNVIHFNNTLFSNIFEAQEKYRLDKELTIQKYGDSDIVEIEKNSPIQVVYSKKDEENSLEKLVVKKILDLRKENIDYKDIVVLSFDRNHNYELKKALEDNFIPCFINEKTNFYHSFGNEIIISYLYFLIDDRDSASLISILLSPLYECDEDDVATIKILSESKYLKYDYNLYEGCLKEKLKKLNDDLEYLRPLVLKNEVLNIISYILKINSFYDDNLNVRDKTNVDYFIDSYNKLNNLSIIEFLEYIESIKDTAIDEAYEISQNDETIKIMTIHQSKGLEFKHVILCNKKEEERNIGVESIIKIDQNLGIGLNYYLDEEMTKKIPSLIKSAIGFVDNMESNLEALRIFYVACTRAQKTLTIIDDDLEISEEVFEEKQMQQEFLNLTYTENSYTNFVKTLLQGDLNINKICNVKQSNLFQEERTINFLNKNEHKDISKYHYVKKEREEIKKTSPTSYKQKLNLNNYGLSYGSLMHKALEILDLKKTYTLDDLRSFYGDDFKGSVENIYDFITNKEVKKIISLADEKDIKHEYPYYLRQKNENSLDIEHGYIDLLIITKEVNYIIDYKTDINVTEKDLINLYEKQLNSYKKVLERKNNKITKTYLYSFFLKKLIEI